MQVTIQNLSKFGEQRVRELREELDEEKQTFGKDERTRQEMAEYFSRVVWVKKCNRESYSIARDIIQLVIEESVYQVGRKIDAFEEMLKQKEYLAQKKDKLDKEIKEIRHRAAMTQVRDDMLDKVIKELALETVKENMYLSKKIDEKMLDILVRALKLERASSTNAEDLQILAQNLEDKKLVAAREAIMNLFEEKELKPDVLWCVIKKIEANKTFEQKWWEINPDMEDKYVDTDQRLNEKCSLI